MLDNAIYLLGCPTSPLDIGVKCPDRFLVEYPLEYCGANTCVVEFGVEENGTWADFSRIDNTVERSVARFFPAEFLNEAFKISGFEIEAVYCMDLAGYPRCDGLHDLGLCTVVLKAI